MKRANATLRNELKAMQKKAQEDQKTIREEITAVVKDNLMEHKQETRDQVAAITEMTKTLQATMLKDRQELLQERQTLRSEIAGSITTVGNPW